MFYNPFEFIISQVDPDAHDGCYTFLQLACDRGMVEVAEFLINKGADPNK